MDSLQLKPARRAAGSVRLPGSKSISNRVLLLAALAEGTTVIHDLLDSDDTEVMRSALRELGCGVESRSGKLDVTGLGGRLVRRSAQLFLGNAGTAMRPLAAALAVLAASQSGRFELDGTARMRERPIGDLVDALRRIGCSVDYLGAEGYPPLRRRQRLVCGVAAFICQPLRASDALRISASSASVLAVLMTCSIASRAWRKRCVCFRISSRFAIRMSRHIVGLLAAMRVKSRNPGPPSER
jgi:3-phosphoshikimate 1-carboxyvinyltransferase